VDPGPDFARQEQRRIDVVRDGQVAEEKDLARFPCLDHFTADLFIFNWPRLASGDPVLVAKALATVAVPLVPAILWYARPAAWRRRHPEEAEGAR
jgi:hypothetical protein